MATFSLSDTARRAQATGNNSAGPFSFSFQVNAQTDLQVYVDSTLKTLTTHYTVSLSTDGTGSVSFTSGNHPTDSQTITILSDVPVLRTSVYTSGGNITAASLESDFDTQTMMLGDREERESRTVMAPVNDPTSVDMTLPAKASRLGTVLGFNATSGNPEAGPKIADVSSLAAITSDISTLADIEDGTDATNAIQTVAGIASNVSTVAGISGNVTTVAGITSNIAAVVADATDIGVVAGKATEIGRLGTSQAVADLDILATTDAVSDMNTLAAISANISTVAGISSNVTTVAGVASLITSDFVSDLNTLATSDIVSDLNTLATADIVSDLNTLATSDIVSDLNTLATSDIVSDMNTLATSDVIADMAALAGSGGAPNISALTITKNSGSGVLPALTILCSDTTATQNQDLGKIEFQTSDSNETGTVSRIVATKTNSTSAVTNEAALEFYTGRPGDLSLSMTINADHTVSFANNITASGTVTGTGTSVFASLDISGDIDVDGTTNLDTTNIVGALDVTGTITSDGLTVDGTASIQPSSASIPSGGNTSADDLIVQSSGHTGMTIGSGTSSTGSIYFADSGSNSIGRIQYNHTDNSLYLQTNAEKRLNIASTGDISFYEDTGTTPKFFWDASAESLGIGTSSPQGVLDLGAPSSGRSLTFDKYNNIFGSYSEGSLNLTSNYYGDTTANAYKTSSTATYGAAGIEISGTGGTSTSGLIQFFVDAAASKTADAAFVPTERMRITSDGSVGIGGAPSDILQVNHPSTALASSIRANATNADAYFAVGNSDLSDFILLFGGHSGNNASTIGWDDSNDLRFATYQNHTGTFGSEAMRITSTGSVGIGTSSPSSWSAAQNQLVVGDGTGDNGITIYSQNSANGNLRFSDGTTGSQQYRGRVEYDHVNDKLFLGAGGTTPFVIDSLQNVGIGTTSPSSLLTVHGSQPIITLSDPDTGSTSTISGNSGHLILNADSGSDASDNTIDFQVDNSQKMRLDASGNLLVGKTTIATGTAGIALRSNGEVRGTADGDYAARFSRLSSNGAIVGFEKDGAAAGSIGVAGGSSNELYIYAESGKGILLNNNGLLAGTSSGGGSDNTTDLGQSDVRFKDLYLSGVNYIGSSSDSDVGIDIKQANLSALITLNGRMNNSGTTTTAIQFKDGSGGNNVGSITVTSGGTAYNTSSDYRLKENVVDLTGATDRLKQIPVHRFNFISNSDTTVDGFLAHEVQTVVPEAITGTHNEVDADGNPVYQGIDQSKLVPLLVATIKELEARITALENA